MTVIRPNSIAGITSLTALGSSIDFYNASGAGIQFNNVNLNNTSGLSTFNSIDATSIVGVSTIGVTTAYIGSINDGPISGFRNLVINGGFDVWQRGTSFTDNAVYTSDRWWFVNDAVGTATVTRQDISSQGLGSQYCLRAERSSGTNRWVVGTNLETNVVKSILGKQITVSFYVRKGSAFTSDISVTFGTSNTEAKFGSLIDFNNFTISNSSLNTSTFTKFSETLNVGAASTALGLKLELSASQAGASNAYFEVAQVQIEEGPIATPFEKRSYGQEFALCCRYYESMETSGSTPLRFGNDGMCISSTVALFQVGGFYPKRSTPVATLSAGNTFAVVNSAGSLIQGTAATVVNYGSHNASVTVTVASGLTAGNSTQLYAAGGQSPKIQLSSEL